MTILLQLTVLLTAAAVIPPGAIRKESESYLLDPSLLTSPAAHELRARGHAVETYTPDGRRGWIVVGDELEPFGIRRGDVVLTINGKVPDAGGRVLARALRAARIVVELSRRSETLRITYSVKKLPLLPDASGVTAPPSPEENHAALEAGIRKLADGEYELARSVLETAIADNGALSRMRIVPETEAGAVHGFRLFSIRPGSLVARLGLMNGDVVLRINGQEMSTPDAALACYASLRTTSELLVELKRAGVERRIRIHLR